ncbi:Glycerol kinase [Pseudomonas syringae pv. actinidiae]|uniref:Glycerol kinase n=1 Tax=Pseudomonas syringae pv. actinidiae TaxID=103796 RepID=A0A2V0Q5K8_PSESF|nr:Glycerol kinase [Pseudomonas syringae pv. actinidiae]
MSNTRFVLFQQLLEAKHHLRAFGRRCITPGRESRLGRFDSLLHCFTTGERHLVDNLPGRWIEDIGGTTIIGYKRAVNQMLDVAHGKNSKEQHQVRITSRPTL